jgi:hypothetical protein
MSGPPSHQFPASMIRVTTSRTWAAVTSVTSSVGPSRTTSSAGSTRCSPAQRHDERGRPARLRSPGRWHASPATETRPVPPPRTRMTGVIPRLPQVLDRGGLIDWPHSSSKTIQPPRAAAVLLSAARSPSSTPQPRRRHARWPGARRSGRSSRSGAAGTRSRDGVGHPEPRGDQVPDAGQRPPLVLPASHQRHLRRH